MEAQKQKDYLTTGEFAKLCHTTKHTLFHYCDIDLFGPAYTDENGYRYYHVLQYDTFMTIAELRAIGMSLKEIKEYLEERSPERMVELYSRQEQRVNQQIARLEKIKTQIVGQKEALQQVVQCSQKYFVEQQAQLYLSCSEWMIQRDDRAMTSSVGVLRSGDARHHAVCSSGMICQRSEALALENYPFCFYVGTTAKPTKECHSKSTGSYLCTYHYGDYEAMSATFRELLAYAQQHQIELDEWIYAETIVGDWAVHQPQEYIIKVSIRVTDKTQNKLTPAKVNDGVQDGPTSKQAHWKC